MRKLVLRIGGTLMLAGAAISALLWNGRRALSYNSEGRYFDPEQVMVLHEQAVAIYGAMALLLGLAGMALWMIAARR